MGGVRGTFWKFPMHFGRLLGGKHQGKLEVKNVLIRLIMCSFLNLSLGLVVTDKQP